MNNYFQKIQYRQNRIAALILLTAFASLLLLSGSVRGQEAILQKQEIEARINAMNLLKQEYKDAVYWMPPKNPRNYRGEHLPPMQAKMIQLEISNLRNENCIQGLTDVQPLLTQAAELAKEKDFRTRHAALEKHLLNITNSINLARSRFVRAGSSPSPFLDRSHAENAAKNLRWSTFVQVLDQLKSQVQIHNRHPTPEAQTALITRLKRIQSECDSQKQRLKAQLSADRAMLAIVRIEIEPTEASLATYDDRVQKLRKKLEQVDR